jgi:hypothetical protein
MGSLARPRRCTCANVPHDYLRGAVPAGRVLALRCVEHSGSLPRIRIGSLTGRAACVRHLFRPRGHGTSFPQQVFTVVSGAQVGATGKPFDCVSTDDRDRHAIGNWRPCGRAGTHGGGLSGGIPRVSSYWHSGCAPGCDAEPVRAAWGRTDGKAPHRATMRPATRSTSCHCTAPQ